MTARDLKVAEAAALLGISPDTVRRRATAAGLEPGGSAGHQTLPAEAVARLATQEAADSHLDDLGDLAPASARNRLRGIVTRVVRDGVMAQVDVQAGPYRVVSLISREAADELGLEPGSLVAATVKATNVGIEGIR
ncbi:MAG TPA: MerR family transcriptional regulator [Micrococcales bacterium]|uniref:TOBE domain-containing protein n=1 Tax=Miniimonas arenae TaxID=676201 RepID=UPI000EF092F6|nr:TOBE domain-containing protein [Miniimonas arenae]HCX85093.1 MerR family transcriptional regulator [Micrococcales bacterium]